MQLVGCIQKIIENMKSYPFNFSNEEIIKIINSNLERLKTEVLTEGQKEAITKNIQLGQNQLITNSLSENIQSIINQSGTLNQILVNNKTTSRVTKYLSFIMIIIAIATLIVTIYTIRENVFDSNHLSKTNDKILLELTSINKNINSINDYIVNTNYDKLIINEFLNINESLDTIIRNQLISNQSINEKRPKN